MTIDLKGNLYIGDIDGQGIGVIEPEHRQYRMLAADARLVWPDGLCFGQDGKLYFYSRTPTSVVTPRDATAVAAEHNMFRMVPLAAGQPGN
jgi:sugar lactone lactonase YvrE